MILITVQPEPVYNCTLQRRPPPGEDLNHAREYFRSCVGTAEQQCQERKTYIRYKHAVNL